MADDACHPPSSYSLMLSEPLTRRNHGLAARATLDHGAVFTTKLVTGLPSLSLKRRHPSQLLVSLMTLKTIVFTPLFSVILSALSLSLSSVRPSVFFTTSLPFR